MKHIIRDTRKYTKYLNKKNNEKRSRTNENEIKIKNKIEI